MEPSYNVGDLINAFEKLQSPTDNAVKTSNLGNIISKKGKKGKKLTFSRVIRVTDDIVKETNNPNKIRELERLLAKIINFEASENLPKIETTTSGKARAFTEPIRTKIHRLVTKVSINRSKTTTTKVSSTTSKVSSSTLKTLKDNRLRKNNSVRAVQYQEKYIKK